MSDEWWVMKIEWRKLSDDFLLSKQAPTIWMAVQNCLMWCIWRERNNRHFEDLERLVSDLKLFFLKTLLDWVTMLGFRSFSPIHDFMDFCTLCTWFVFVLDVYFMHTLVTPPLLFNIFLLLIKKKKKSCNSCDHMTINIDHNNNWALTVQNSIWFC